MRKFRDNFSRILAGILMVVTAAGLGTFIPSGKADKVNAAGIVPVEINDTNFPDPVFRSVISGPDYDRDGNGILDENEISLTINIYCEGMGISSIKGVEYFVNLQGLWCKDNQIASMDLSNNKDLHGVWCSGNLFTSLDFSANPELEWVYCYDCNLTSLNISNNPNMAYVECNTNPLTSLDLTNNPKLEHLTCGTCELTSLDLSKNPNLSHLDAFSNHLTKLDISHNPKMKRLDIWNNPGLGSIDLSNNPGLQYYNCAYNGAKSIDLSNNPELLKLICSYNDITSLDLSNNPKLVYLDCACNELTSLDLSNNPSIYFLQAFTNNFTKLDIGANPSLVKTYKEGTKKNESSVCQGHSWTIDYGGDTSTGDDNIYFLCFDDKVTLTTDSKSTLSKTTNTKTVATGDEVTREAAAWTLYSMAGSPSTSGLKSRFTDLEDGTWYEDALLWGEKNSICVGTPDVSSDTFGVGQPITRQDLALMLMRYSEYKNYKRSIDFGRSDEFKDYYDIDYYAWEAICWAATYDIITGKGQAGAPKSELNIDPHGTVTQSEFETIIKRMLEVNGVAAPSTFPVPPADTKAGTKTGDDASQEVDTSKENIAQAGDAEEIAGSETGGSNIEETSIEEANQDENISVSANDLKDKNDRKSKIVPFLITIAGIFIAAFVAKKVIEKRYKEKHGDGL